jgi:hypothetical protein
VQTRQADPIVAEHNGDAIHAIAARSTVLWRGAKKPISEKAHFVYQTQAEPTSWLGLGFVGWNDFRHRLFGIFEGKLRQLKVQKLCPGVTFQRAPSLCDEWKQRRRSKRRRGLPIA